MQELRRFLPPDAILEQEEEVRPVGEVKARLMVDPAVPLSGVIIPAGGPAYMLQRLAAWPEQYFPCGWHRVFVSLTPAEE